MARSASPRMDANTAHQPEDPSGFVDERARGEYIRLGIGCFLAAVMNAHSALLAIIFARSGYDLHDIGLLLSIFAIPVVLSALISGAVADRIGALQTVRLAMALLAIGFLSFDVTRASFTAAAASRIVQGVGQGLFLGSALTYAQGRLSPVRFVYLLGIFSSLMVVSQALGPPLGAYVLGSFGEHAMFAVAALPAIAGLALTFGLRPLPRPAQSPGLRLFWFGARTFPNRSGRSSSAARCRVSRSPISPRRSRRARFRLRVSSSPQPQRFSPAGFLPCGMSRRLTAGC